MATMQNERPVIYTVITALLIDLLAFTIILPLFPRLLNYYRQEEAGKKHTFLGYALDILERYKDWIGVSSETHEQKWDTVLLGGLLGSLFSMLQFVISPMIGRASDKHGRRRVLLWTMVGNLVSTAIWLFARSFTLFLLARIVAGISEGNVQLSIAIISDITTPEQRSRSLALVGISFAVAFTLGPAIGAWFASIDLSELYPSAAKTLNIYPYSMPALVALALLSIETLYIFRRLPETKKETSKQEKKDTVSIPNDPAILQRISNLRKLKLIHCLHLFLFSGMEFTLVFLTFDVLDYSNLQQGRLLGYMGILSALIQGGYVRRRVQKVGERKLVIQGMFACVLGLASLSLMVSSVHPIRWLYFGVSCLALTTGTVVNCLTGMASLQCQDDNEANVHPSLAKGRALGEFRSSGQLGRALGPVSACGLYWIAGPARCYGIASMVMAFILLFTVATAPKMKIKSN